MLIHIPALLAADQVAQCRRVLAQIEWIDGRATAGYQSERVKHNMQVPEGHPATRPLIDMILTALERNPLFITAALPQKIVPPLFNRYAGGQSYGSHIDGGIRPVPGTPHRVRTDLSATLFLTAREDYDGGELVVEDTYGAHRIKLPAGDLILYSGTSRHRVEPVTRGARVSSFFWIQSMVRDDTQRTQLFELDTAIQHLARTVPDHAAILQITNVYHNLLRLWAEV
jgi:PKHD-type hydroxylase